ncbi:hypothetical protein KXD93_08835 [Mucilaginibacter sp. BJC16-A38]|uniref:hypothetical protein n=1 Tax=Mucilaginibacter phenanthrenivorans TaxID=1234842 RepID=UPI00215772B3|nr:hypothetical protein [Mucilaginibacter phenanthrenivorans]MCR8557744.1 hypothetical protein [Mucilaginibacter phenanthrenivorans]
MRKLSLFLKVTYRYLFSQLKIVLSSPLFYLIAFSIILIVLCSDYRKYAPIKFPNESSLKKIDPPSLHINWLPSPEPIPGGKVNMCQEILVKGLQSRDVYTDTLKYGNTGHLVIGGEKFLHHDDFSYANFGSVTSYVRSELVTPPSENWIDLVLVDTTGWKPDYYQSNRTIDFTDVLIRSLSADHMAYRGDRISRFDLENVNLRLLQIIGTPLGKTPQNIDFVFDPLVDPEQLPVTQAKTKDSIKQLSIYYHSVRNVISPYINVLRLDSCLWSDTVHVACSSASALIFNNVKFKAANVIANLDNARPGAILFLRKVDLSKFDFDYSHFEFAPFDVRSYKDQNEWYSDVVSIYNSIIASQTRLNNIQGIKASTIALNEFQDYYTWYARPFIGLKVWWNDYGFDKGKAVTSSLLILGIFFFVNLLFMDLFLDQYDVAGVKNAWEITATVKFKHSRYLILSLMYTSIIFYGIKLDFAQLKTKRLDVTICLLIEYISGLIAIAYIANLIISK